MKHTICKIKKCKTLFQGAAFDVVVYQSCVDGKEIKREIIERKHGVVIVPIDEDNNVYLTSEYCAGSNSYILSLPGGSIEPLDQSIEEAAQRELLEEIGYKATNLIKLQYTYTHPSISSRRSHVFMAYGISKNKGIDIFDSEELIDITVMHIDDAIKACYTDFISDVSTISNLFMAKEKLISMGQYKRKSV